MMIRTNVTTDHQILFLPNQFSVLYIYTEFRSKFSCFLTLKSPTMPTVTRRLASQETVFKKSNYPSGFFFRKIIGSKNCFIPIEVKCNN